MKHFIEVIKQYAKNMSICDLGLLKFCMCAVGVVIGLSIPQKKRSCAAFAASAVFAITYVLLMIPFLKLFVEAKAKLTSEEN